MDAADRRPALVARLRPDDLDGDVQAVVYNAGTVYFGFHGGYNGNTNRRSWPPTHPPASSTPASHRP